jgi:hypothetical protein
MAPECGRMRGFNHQTKASTIRGEAQGIGIAKNAPLEPTLPYKH